MILKGLKNFSEAITSISLPVIHATIGAVTFSDPIVSLLYGRGAFDTNAVVMTSQTLFFYSIGMLGFGLREVLSRVFLFFKRYKDSYDQCHNSCTSKYSIEFHLI